MTEPTPRNQLPPADEYCTAREAADYAGCTVETIRQWIHEKRLDAKRPNPFGSSRIRVDVASLRKLIDP